MIGGRVYNHSTKNFITPNNPKNEKGYCRVSLMVDGEEGSKKIFTAPPSINTFQSNTRRSSNDIRR